MQKIKNNVVGSEKIEWRKLQWFQVKLKNLSESNLQKLKNSLKKGFISGFKATYLNDQLFILDGHNRQTAMTQLENEGFQFDDLLPVEIIDCGNSKKRAAEILLQINSHYAKITNEGLDEFVAEFDVDLSTINTDFELPDIDLDNFCFSENELTDEQLNDCPEIQEEAITQLGDLFLIDGKHRLLCGDCTLKENIEFLMDGKKADMVFTDPPYDIKNEDYAESIFLNTENSHIFVMHDDIGIIKYLKKSQLEFKRFYIADFTFSCPRGNDPYLRHILISQEVKGDFIKHQNMYDGFSSIIKIDYRGNLKDEKLHNHQKSIEFINKFINHFSKKNNIILDLFLGSGSTLIASEQNKRICYGTEIDEHYCDVILKRYKKLFPNADFRCLTNPDYNFNKLFENIN